MKKDKVYFISDAHIGGGKYIRPPCVREDALIDFLRAIRNDAECLYIVGDLFDFWFEYRSVVPAHGARVIFELYHLVQGGTRVIYLPGNHDSWLGGYLSEQVGAELPGPFCDVVHQDRRLYVTHGDIFQQHWKFALRRRVLKHPLCIALFQVVTSRYRCLSGAYCVAVFGCWHEKRDAKDRENIFAFVFY